MQQRVDEGITMKNAEIPFVAVIGGLWQFNANKSAAAKAAGNVIGGELAKAGFGLVVSCKNKRYYLA
jgi:hypothetical protein